MGVVGLGCVLIGILGRVVLDYPDRAFMLLGFGGAGLAMLARAVVSDKIAGAILLVVGVVGAAVFYTDNADLIGAIGWFAGWAAGGIYLMWFARPLPSP